MYENHVKTCPDRYMAANVNSTNWMRTSVTKYPTGHVAFGQLVTLLTTFAGMETSHNVLFFFPIHRTMLMAD